MEKFLNGETLIFDANVTESLTQFKLGDKEELKFYNNPVKVEFPKSLSSTFKPSMDYTGVVRINHFQEIHTKIVLISIVVALRYLIYIKYVG